MKLMKNNICKLDYMTFRTLAKDVKGIVQSFHRKV